MKHEIAVRADHDGPKAAIAIVLKILVINLDAFFGLLNQV